MPAAKPFSQSGLGNPSDSVQGRELIERLRDAIGRLELKHRLPVSLCYEQGLTQNEAAEALKIPRTTLASHLDAGLEQIRYILKKAGYHAAPAVVIAALAHTAPTLPASLATALDKLSLPKTDIPVVSVWKGGLLMKIGLGVAAAGLVAGILWGTAGGKAREGSGPQAESPAGASPAGNASFTGKVLYAEHFSFVRIGIPGGLAGPARQACKAMAWAFCAQDHAGNFFIAEPQNDQVHWIDRDGNARIIAGDGKKGFRDGPGTRARFDFGCGSYNDIQLHCDDTGNVYVSDGMNNRLRKIDRKEDGSWQVTTVAGGGDKRVKKGEWIPATDLKFGCAPRWGLSPDGKVAMYATYGGLYKVLLQENKATLLATVDEIQKDSGAKAGVVSWHVDGGFITTSGVYYWMPGASPQSAILRFDEKVGKAEREVVTGGGNGAAATVLSVDPATGKASGPPILFKGSDPYDRPAITANDKGWALGLDHWIGGWSCTPTLSCARLDAGLKPLDSFELKQGGKQDEYNAPTEKLIDPAYAAGKGQTCPFQSAAAWNGKHVVLAMEFGWRGPKEDTGPRTAILLSRCDPQGPAKLLDVASTRVEISEDKKGVAVGNPSLAAGPDGECLLVYEKDAGLENCQILARVIREK